MENTSSVPMFFWSTTYSKYSKRKPRPTSYSKINVANNYSTTSRRLFINDKIFSIIKKWTEVEARSKLNIEAWSISLYALDSFIEILYFRGNLASKGSLGSLGPLGSLVKDTKSQFFPLTMRWSTFLEMMRFIRFDFKISRSDRLKYDKFALISHVWNTSAENCLMCYKPGRTLLWMSSSFNLRHCVDFCDTCQTNPINLVTNLVQ